ncbi:MAG: S9 family peptidase [bacterium]|nr:S9 family peptidase [bacterium]
MAKTKKEPPGKSNDPVPTPPRAEKIRKELTLHQDTRIDNYYWLNQRENPKVLEYLTAENNYLKAVMKHTEGLQEKLYNEIVGRIQQEDTAVPYRSNGYYYCDRYETGREYPFYCRRKGSMEGKEEIILNVNEMAEGFDYYKIKEEFAISPDNTMAAYGEDTVSRRKYTIRFKNLVTGETLPDKIPNTDGMPLWAADNKTVFYAAKDHTLRAYKIFSHRVGTPVSEDREMFHEADTAFSLELKKSKSNKYIFIYSSSTLSTEYLFLDANHPEKGFRVVEPRKKNHEYEVAHYKDKWIILTNHNAKNYRLMETAIDKSSLEHWKELVPHREDVFIEDYDVSRDYLVLKERKEGLQQLRIIKWDSRDSHYIQLDAPAYEVKISDHQEFDTPVLRYTFSSFAVPDSVYDYHMSKKEKKLLKQDRVGGGFDAANYTTRWIWATARDGVKVPVSLVHRKGLKKNGDNPLYLYAYGSYGSSEEIQFSEDILSLLDRGFVFAVAHVRGGQEMGRQWYDDGKLFKKKNTFTDFIDCAKFLVAEKFTNPAKLFAGGGSAGGLLMGVVVNLEPALFKAVIARVPFVDVITTMLDTSIPLTTSEFDEWGDPTRKDFYDYMLSYSPYDRLEAKDYPPLLVTAGLHDSQVQYFEPAKWVAKLRELKTDKNLLIFHTNMAGGHSGSSGRFRKHKSKALQYAFILDQLGIKE